RQSDELHQGPGTVNGLEAAAELADPHGGALAEIGSEVREAAFNPGCKGLAPAIHHDRRHRESDHEDGEKQTGLLKIRIVRQALGSRGQECRHDQQEGKAANIENAFHGPNRNLRGKAQVVPSRDQVGTNQLSRASQYRQPGKTDQGRGHQPEGGSLGANRAQENLPAECPHNVCDVDERNRVSHMPQIDMVGLRPERSPIEVPPGTKLNVNQDRKHYPDESVNAGLFLVHRPEMSTPCNEERMECEIPLPSYMTSANGSICRSAYRLWRRCGLDGFTGFGGGGRFRGSRLFCRLHGWRFRSCLALG